MASKFGRGAENAKKAVEANKPSGGGDRINYFKMADGETKYFRLVHDGDEWYYMKYHAYIPTKPEPEWWKKIQAKRDAGDRRKFPARMDAGCRKDPAFDYDGCFVCDDLHKHVEAKNKSKKWWPQIRYFVPMIEREEVVGTQEMIDAGDIPETVNVRGEDVSTVGRKIGRRDKMVTRTKIGDDGKPIEGETETVPSVVLCKMGYDNFFAQLQGVYEMTADENDDEQPTLLNRDIRVKREGDDTSTKYLFKEMKIEGADLRDPEVRKKYDLIDIEKVMEESASDEFFAKFIDWDLDYELPEDDDESGGEVKTAKRAPKAEQRKPEETAADGDEEDDEETTANLSALKSKLTKGHGRKAAAEEPEKESATVGASSGDGDDEDD